MRLKKTMASGEMADNLVPAVAQKEHQADKSMHREDTEEAEERQETGEVASGHDLEEEQQDEHEDGSSSLGSSTSRDGEALRRIAEKFDEEKAPALSEFNATAWRIFQLEYKDYKDNGGLKSMARCIARPLQAQLQWELPQQFRRVLFDKVPDDVLIESLSDQFTSRTVTQLLNELGRVSMRSTSRGMRKDVVNYFIELDEVKLQFENIELNDELYCEQIIRGLTPVLGFRQEVKNEYRQRRLRSADDLQTLILELARKLEQEYHSREPHQMTRSGSGGTAGLNRAKRIAEHRQQERQPQQQSAERSGRQGQDKAKSVDRSATEAQVRCFNCQGPHLLKDCTKRRNEAVISANAAAYDDNKKKHQLHAKALRTGPSAADVKIVELDELHVPARLPNASTVVGSAHVKSRLVMLDEQIVVLLDSGACVSLMKQSIAERLMEAGCPSRRVTKQVHGFDGQPKLISTQLLGVELMIRGPTGNVLLKVDPYVTEIMDDVIIDKFTAMNAGILEIKVDPNHIIPEGTSGNVGCVYCGAVYDPLPESGPSSPVMVTTPAAGPKDPDALLTNTIGPDVSHDRMLQVLQTHKAVFTPCFNEEISAIPPFTIEVHDSALLPRKGPRRLSNHDLSIVKQQVSELQELGVIRPSSSRVSSPIVLVKYEDGSSRLCVDYRELNDNTVPLRYPTRNLREVVDRIAGYKYLGKIDLYKGYHQIAMDPASIYLTAFATSFGLFEYTRLPFGLKNAPAAFQQAMDTVFAGLLYRVCEVYLDDIIIFGDTEEEFLHHVGLVLDKLQQCKLYAKVTKCLFGYAELPFLGFLVSHKGYRMHPDRIQAIVDMPYPRSRKELRSYLGLVNYFASFIANLAALARPLYDLCHAKTPYQWTERETQSFQTIQQRIAHVPSLEFLNYDHPIYLRTDASDLAVGGVLFQEYDDSVHIVQFLSKAFSQTEKRWSTIEKEAYALYYCILHCGHYLSGHHFVLQTDHRNLVYLHRAEVPKLVRWRLRLQEFDFTVQHIAGASNIVADVLSRICPDCLRTPASSVVIAAVSIAPDRREQIGKFHNATLGHRGVTATLSMLKQSGIDWLGMAKDVAEYIRCCSFCQKNRPFREAPGPNMSLTVYEPFQRLAMDFIGPLPADVDGNIFILVVVDAFSRWVELFPVAAATADVVASALFHICCRYGLPEQILSDNGSQFTSQVVKALMDRLDIDHVFSAPHHHAGNGQVERCNREVMRHLRAIVFDEEMYHHWSSALPRVQYVLNTTSSTATGVTPIALLYGDSITAHRALPNVAFAPESESTTQEYTAKQAEKVAALLQTSRDKQAQAESARLQGQPEKPDEFYVHELVLVRYPVQPPDKLSPRLQGPYRVIAKHHHRSYEVENPLTKQTYRVDVERLTRFHVNDTNLQALEQIVAKDYQEFVVEAIVDHRRNASLPGGYEFLVKWKGYADSANTWEPTAHLKNNVYFRDYIKSHRIRLAKKNGIEP